MTANNNVNKASSEEYLEKKVRCLIEPMVSALLIEKPKEPVFEYII